LEVAYETGFGCDFVVARWFKQIKDRGWNNVVVNSLTVKAFEHLCDGLWLWLRVVWLVWAHALTDSKKWMKVFELLLKKIVLWSEKGWNRWEVVFLWFWRLPLWLGVSLWNSLQPPQSIIGRCTYSGTIRVVWKWL
jgi:hypothetical protein